MHRANLFHDLDEARSADPDAFVLVSSFNQWLGGITSRTIQFLGATASMEKNNQGVHAKLPATGAADPDVLDPPWEVRNNGQGWTVRWGRADGMVPTIGGVPIDEEFTTAETQRPHLTDLADGVVAIRANIRFTHADIPTLGTVGGAVPPYVATYAWLDWPAVMWQQEITPVMTVAIPPVGTFNDSIFSIPLAKITNRRVHRLRWGHVFLSGTYVFTVTEEAE